MSDRFSTRKLEPVDLNLYAQNQNCDRWAVIVGISRYKHNRLNLKYADRDAEELYNVLTTPTGGGFKREHICKLTNEEATTQNITRALRSFLKKPAREDLVVIYFACHGAPDFDRPGNVYLLSHDSDPDDIAGTALPMREIDLSLKENLHAEKVIVLVDACHSAAIGGGIGRRSAIDDSTLLNRYLQQMSQAKGGLALLTSAEANEVSLEDSRWGGGHGVFTHYLLEGMRGAADIDQNGIVTIGELFEYVRDNVKRATEYRQHPLIGSNAFDRNLPIAFVPQKLQATGQVDSVEQRTVQENLRIPASQQSRLRELFPAGAQPFEFQMISVNEFGQPVDQQQQVAECFVEDLGNSVLLEMVFVPEGSFLMGTSGAKAKAAEKPQHPVTVKPFLMSKYLITIAQWSTVASLPQIHQSLKRRPSRQGTAHQPVVNISWHDAVEFCDRLAQKTGKAYRLSTEAEWEYACRAGTQTPFHFGETLTSDIANCDATFPYRAAPPGIRCEKTTPVGSFQVANRFGLFDMHGNVWEWCLDHWHKRYTGAPTSGEAWLDNIENPNRVLRGGSWRNEPLLCRSASRWYGPVNEGATNIGFRIALPLY
ncbi:SUMF1/EgtB/PvdO family nonheme iron enzyme [Leptolyngbya sp. ST-U4]|uniref:SUMF1/EgtB/PvdO family nonheme iron enzyme n=1 Tax=Leptolyngbya sp. ST-U4 TaxID=2933912 RepID=UPI003298E7F8